MCIQLAAYQTVETCRQPCPIMSGSPSPLLLGQGLQPRCDIHPVAENIFSLDNHIAEVDPNPELDPLLWRSGRVAVGHPPLHLHGAPDGVDHAGELGQEPVAGGLDDTPPVLGDLRLDQVPEVGLETLVRPLLIRPIRRASTRPRRRQGSW